jgi:hypothetical protein
MTDQEIIELAAILAHEHGPAALRVAEGRRAQHRRDTQGHRLWTRIADETKRLLRERQRQEAKETCS